MVEERKNKSKTLLAGRADRPLPKTAVPPLTTPTLGVCFLLLRPFNTCRVSLTEKGGHKRVFSSQLFGRLCIYSVFHTFWRSGPHAHFMFSVHVGATSSST